MYFTEQHRKPIFGIDTTSNKHNEIPNGSEFISATASEQARQECETKQEALEQTVQKSEHPAWLQIVKLLCGVFCLIVLSSTIKVGFATAWKNAPILLVIGALCGIIWLILQILSKAQKKKVLEDGNAEQQVEEIDKDMERIYAELNVPKDALDVDVLIFRYKVKNGEIRPQAPFPQTTAFINLSVKLFATEDAVSLADLESVYTFDKSELQAITAVNKRISVIGWNKDEDPRKGIYKPYKMTVNNVGNVFLKPYYILEIDHYGQNFGIYFPCYELEAFERITGLTAKE